MSILSRKIYREIEHWFYNYAQIKKQVIEAKTDIYAAGRQYHDNAGGGVPYKSDQTAVKAIKLASAEIMQAEAICKVVEKTVVKFQGTAKGRLLAMRYYQKRGKFVIMDDLNIERATFYHLLNDIVYYAAILAQKFGTIDIEKVV